MKDQGAFNDICILSLLKARGCILICGFCFFLSTFLPSLSWARPPSKIILEYDQQKKILHMEFKHVSLDPRKHYLRRVLIYKNDEDFIQKNYSSQTNAQGLIQDLTIDLKPGDVIRVLAICSDAGRKEETLIIPGANEESKSP